VAQALTPGRCAIAVALVSLAGGALTLNHHLVGVFYDDGLYASLAWALSHGYGYAHPNLPGAPAAIHFPPLYPLVLSPLFGLLTLPAAAFSGLVLNLVFASAASGLVAWHAIRTELLGPGIPGWVVAALVALAALAIPVLTILSALLSEPVFTLLLVAAIILADRPPRSWTPDRAAAAAGLAAALSFLTRSLGLAAGIGVVVWTFGAARERRLGVYGPVARRRAMLAGAPFAAACLAWFLWVGVHRGGLDPLLASDYGSYLAVARGAGVGALTARIVDLVRPLSVLVLGWVPNRIVYYAVGVPALVVGLYGLLRLLRRSPIGVTLVAYLAVLACWPIPPDRFLWAVLPWLTLVWASGAAALWRRAALRVPIVIVIVALAGGYARYEIRGFAGRWWDLAAQRISTTLTTVLPAIDSLPPTAVIAADHDPLIWLYTRRPAVPFYLYRLDNDAVLEPSAAVHRAYLERQGVTHILLAGREMGASEELERLAAAYPGWLVAVRHWPDGQELYMVRREP